MSNLSQAIEFLVEQGYVVERKRRQLYKTNNKQVDIYRIIHFDAKHNLCHVDEENFKEIKKAVERFVKLT